MEQEKNSGSESSQNPPHFDHGPFPTFNEAIGGKPEPKSWVYFITDGEAIKVGWAKNVERRLWLLQTSHHKPLSVLRTLRGDRVLEKQFHRRWKEHRIRGEWFRDAKEIRYFIDFGRLMPKIIED